VVARIINALAVAVSICAKDALRESRPPEEMKRSPEEMAQSPVREGR
jgi:hypothetical protein